MADNSEKMTDLERARLIIVSARQLIGVADDHTLLDAIRELKTYADVVKKLEKLEVEDGDFLIVKNVDFTSFSQVTEDIRKIAGKEIIFFAIPEGSSIEALNEDEMATFGWFRKRKEIPYALTFRCPDGHTFESEPITNYDSASRTLGIITLARLCPYGAGDVHCHHEAKPIGDSEVIERWRVAHEKWIASMEPVEGGSK